MSIEDQPPPKPQPTQPAAWLLVVEALHEMRKRAVSTMLEVSGEIFDLVEADMHERNQLGCERYGMPLTAFNGRDQLIDCYQELLDAAVYCRAWIAEHMVDIHAPVTDPDCVMMAMLLGDTMASILLVRKLIEARKLHS